ncbi:MAG: hypothetical protein C0514_00325 [Candidatus Puniceispirillum sp.]|nr:hypothetical protein [Candidatus Puniceispirillum sp.]
MKSPLCGLPYKESGFDGIPKADSETFLGHDWPHVTYNEKVRIYHLSTVYDAYSKLYTLVSSQADPCATCDDHFWTFLIMHEGLNNFGGPKRPKGLNLPLSCKSVKERLADDLSRLQSTIDRPTYTFKKIVASYKNNSPIGILIDKQVPKDAPLMLCSPL